MARFRPRSAVALVAWTLFTWVSRVPLLWSDEEQSAAGKVAQSVPVLVFVGLAVAAVVALARRGPWTTLAGALAAWSIAYWLVRYPLILANDHEAAFKVVHGVLAVVAIALGAWTLAELRASATRRARA